MTTCVDHSVRIELKAVSRLTRPTHSPQSAFSMTVCVGEEVPCVFWMHVRMRVNVFVFNYKNKDCFIVYIKIDALALSIFFLKLFSVRYQTYQICFHFLWHIRLICPDLFLFLFPYIAQTYSTEILLGKWFAHQNHIIMDPSLTIFKKLFAWMKWFSFTYEKVIFLFK